MKSPLFLLSSVLLSSTLLLGCGGDAQDAEFLSSDDDSSVISEDSSTADEDSSATDEDSSTADEDSSTADEDSSTADEDSSTADDDAFSSILVINEIVASAADDGSDWIELYALQGSVALASYSLVDDKDGRIAQALPDVTLAEGEFIVIQAIDDEATPPAEDYYVTFKLGSDDAVTLFKDAVQVDQLDWEEGDAHEGFSYGLFTDGLGNAQTLAPTPGTANEESSASILDTDTETDTGTELTVFDTIINEDAPLRVNEVVSKESADGYDWIEFYVTGKTSVNLSDYSVADENNERVTLPNVIVSAGDFYRVYATTDDVVGLDTVSFKLGGSDQVSIFQGDDLVDQLVWNKGQALIGFSYGRFPDGSDATKTLSPSPLTSNVLALHGPLVINEILADDIDGGDDWFELYNNGTETIALSDYQVIDESDDIDAVSLPDISLAPGEFVVIFANGNTGTESDYAVPFKLGKTDELSLILNDETVDYIDWDDSDVSVGFSFGLSTVSELTTSWHKDFLTPTPGSENQLATAFNPELVQTLSITISTENWQDILANPLDEEYHQTSISFNGVTLDSVAIRTKGGSSLSSVANSTSDRYSFKIDINEYVSGQKFFGLKKFTLQNSFNDPSYMREVIAYDLLEEMGVATPEHAYVNFYVNGELFGLYLMVEVIDGEFLENHFANSNGDLYKPDGTGSDLQWINDDISSYSDINLQTNEDSSDNGAFMNFVAAMDAGATDVINVDGLLRYMSVSVALANLDSYYGTLAHNYYLYEDDGVFSLLPWDFNESFGSFAMDCDSVDIRELYIDEPTSGALADRPLVANAFASADNLATYHEYLWLLINGPLVSDTFSARITAIADLIGEHVNNDPSAFYSYAEFTLNLNSTVDRYYGLTEFMDYRVENMTQQLTGDLPTAGTGSGFCGASTNTGGGGGPGR